MIERKKIKSLILKVNLSTSILNSIGFASLFLVLLLNKCTLVWLHFLDKSFFCHCKLSLLVSGDTHFLETHFL